MEILYFLSGPDGDIPLADLGPDHPFSLSPGKTHPFLTLGDYFDTIAGFIRKDECAAIKKSAAVIFNRDIDHNQIDKILVRSEKHGALYHIASLEICCRDRSFKLAVTTAVGPGNSRLLIREFEILQTLAGHARPYLPRVAALGDEHYRAGSRSETIMLMLGEWLDDFHEWHLTRDKQNGFKIVLWNCNKGHQLLGQAAGFEIIRQAARILTSYYDPEDFRQIYPWHHAAGDFVVQDSGAAITVRLITARNYAPQLEFTPGDPQAPVLAIISFLLNLTIRLRLDRLDGVGEVVWLDSFAVKAAITGFFEALGDNTRQDNSGLLTLLCSFSPAELAMLCNPLLEVYSAEDPDDLTMIRARLAEHCSRLWQDLQDFEL